MPRPNVYRFDGIDGVATLIGTFCSQMDLDLDGLDATFASVLAGDWDGRAAQAFQVQSNQWHQHAIGIRDALYQMGTHVSDAGVHMNETDAIVTNQVEEAAGD